MDLSRYRKYSERLYNDRFMITRYIEIEENDGSTSEGLDPNPRLVNIPCRLSTIKEDEYKLNQEDVNKAIVKFKVFCPPEVKVLKGDSITVEKFINGKRVDIIKAVASKPVIYDLNQEFILIQKEEA